MGQRSNLLLVENNSYKLFYCHWCANTLPHDVFWGPEYAIPFVTKQRVIDENDWLDEVWAEGGVVIDLSRRVLLVFGGEDILYDIPLRRLYFALLQEIWIEWDVR